ncbi:hypothetical protein AB0L00_38450 [Actinoallomurus sp. NPDC052308]
MSALTLWQGQGAAWAVGWVSTLLALIGTVLPIGAALRARAVELVGTRE